MTKKIRCSLYSIPYLTKLDGWGCLPEEYQAVEGLPCVFRIINDSSVYGEGATQ